jgi:hypothetical protein
VAQTVSVKFTVRAAGALVIDPRLFVTTTA